MDDSAASLRVSATPDSTASLEVSEKLPPDAPDKHILPPPSSEASVGKSALKMRRYRQRIKDKGQSQWEEYRQRENASTKRSKQNRSAEKKEQAKEKDRTAAQRRRKMRKAEGLPLYAPKKILTRKSAEEKREKDRLAPKMILTRKSAEEKREKDRLAPKKILTRISAEEKREKDRLRQQEYRSQMSSQKRTWINKKRREKRALLKALGLVGAAVQLQESAKMDTAKSMPSESGPSCSSTPVADTLPPDSSQDKPSTSGYPSRNAELKAYARLKKRMPQSPHKYKRLLHRLSNVKSPSKRSLLSGTDCQPAKIRKLDFSVNIENKLCKVSLKKKKDKKMDKHRKGDKQR